MEYRPSRHRTSTTRQVDSDTRAARRAKREKQAARERIAATAVLSLVLLLGAVGAFVTHPADAAHATARGATVASSTTGHATLACPYNGCTSSKCHAKGKPPKAKRSSKKSAVHIASVTPKSAPAPVTQSTGDQVAANARVTAAAAAAKRSVAQASSPKVKRASASKKTTRSTAKKSSKGTITIVTFGYSFAGPPSGCKYVADVRNIQAGSFSPDENGLMASVRKRVMAAPQAQAWHKKMVSEWLPNLKGGDKIAIGCARGHHRSVTLAVVFSADLEAQGFTVKLVNRDIHKTW